MIRRLGPEDAAAYAEIRLEGLERAPDAFGSDTETERAWPLDRFAEQLTRNTVWGFEEAGGLLGVVGFHALTGSKRRHRGVLWGMYVRDAARGRGVGRQLVDALLAHADGVVEQVHLDVSVGNEAAIALYERCGFRRYGTTPRCMKIDGCYVDADLMVCVLAERGGT